jgi:hypothetical protein
MLTCWAFQWELFIVIGLILMIQSIVLKEWLCALFGGNFLSLGVFSFGCALVGCFTENCNSESPIGQKVIS